MTHIQFNYSKVLDQFVGPHELDYMQAPLLIACFVKGMDLVQIS